MPENAIDEPLKPYDGPPATPDNFTRAFPQMEKLAAGGGAAIAGLGAVSPKGRNPLDPLSEQNLAELRRQIRANPFKAATVINLHPWDLQCSDTFLRGIVIPACAPGMDFAYHHIRSWSHDKRYSEDGTHFLFSAIKPIEKAAQFLLKFTDAEVYGGGVIIYEGDQNPSKVKDVELYALDGRALYKSEAGYEFDDEGNRLPSEQQIPIKGNLHDLIEQGRKRRNEFYLKRVSWADKKFKSKDPDDHKEVTDNYMRMAEVLVAEGILPAAPEWNLSSRMEQGLAQDNCRGCGKAVARVSYKCTNCNNIIDPYEAFMDHAIEWGHVKLESLNEDQYKAVEAEHKRRQEVRKARAKKEKPE